MTPTFTVLIGALGRPSLRAALESIARQQRVPGDQVLVGIDTYEQGERPDVIDLIHSFGEGFEACSYDAGYHCYGTEQINHALNTLQVTGSHLFTIGDDDVFVDGAYATLRPLCAEDPLRPILYRFVAPWRELLWDLPRMERGRISGCCIAAPRSLAGPMPTRNANGQPYPEHDFDWMMQILQASQLQPLWLDEVLVIARPEARGADVTHRGLTRCWLCRDWRYREDVPVSEAVCRKCGAVIHVPGEAMVPVRMQAQP